jgi:hypothetical protein
MKHGCRRGRGKGEVIGHRHNVNIIIRRKQINKGKADIPME